MKVILQPTGLCGKSSFEKVRIWMIIKLCWTVQSSNIDKNWRKTYQKNLQDLEKDKKIRGEKFDLLLGNRQTKSLEHRNFKVLGAAKFANGKNSQNEVGQLQKFLLKKYKPICCNLSR